MKLDRSKPFGTVHGGSTAFFEQGGVLFDAQENEIKPAEPARQKPGPKPKAAEPVSPPEPLSPVDAQLTTQLGD